MASQASDLVLWTSHRCPFAHRAHIVLSELGIPFEEKLVDLNVPRTPEYLKVNPRGQVPTLVYKGEVIRESAIVAEFIANQFPSHIVPATSDSDGPLARARIAFFVDAWTSRVQPHYVKAVYSKTDEETEKAAPELVAAVVKEIEPLLEGAAPFFGGKEKITLAEVLTGSFVIRTLHNSKHGIIPGSVNERLEKEAPKFWSWAQEIAKHPAVLSVYDELDIIKATWERRAKIRAAA